MHNSKEMKTTFSPPEKYVVVRGAPPLKTQVEDTKQMSVVQSEMDGNRIVNLMLDRTGGTAGLRASGARKNGNGKSKKGKALHSSRLPPTLEAVISFRHVYRFYTRTAITSTGTNITGNGLAGALGGLCYATNASIKPFCSSAKINKITIFPAATVSGQPPANVEVIWYNPGTNIEKDTSKDSTMPAGISTPGTVVSIPPRGTLCGEWLNLSSTGATALFQLSGLDIGTIVDLDVSATISNNLSANTQTAAACSISVIYYLALDGSTNHALPPLGKPTTF